jgi:condensin complex subunit 1
MNIKKIFKNKIINEDFLNSLIKICFDSLEILNESKNLYGNGKEKIFEILQVIVTKYQNVQILLLKLTTKIVELIFNQENLVINLSQFISLAIQGTDSNMNKLAIDIVQEISKIVHQHQIENSNSSDSQGIKNVGKFLVNLSEKSPKIMHNNISCLISLFNCEAYVIRNSLLEILGNIIVLILCKTDDIPDVDMRNSYLRAKEKYIDILFDRIYDKNSYCRSKVLQIFEKLCENNCVTMSNYYRLIDEASKRLKDDKSQVRKKAIGIINRIIIIYSQIFRTTKFLTVEELEKIILDTNENIKKLEDDVKRIETRQIEISIKKDKNEFNNNNNKMDLVKEEESYNNENDNNNDYEEILNQEKILKKEEIDKETEYLHFFDNYKRVVTSINRIVPIAILLIGSKNSSDVIQTIELIVSLHKFRINSSFEGIRKMLTLFIKPEESIKKKLIEAYRDLFFDSDKTAEIQAAYLVNLAINLNFSEKKCLKEMMKLLIETKSLTNNNLFKEIWKIFLRNPTDEILKFNFSSKKEANEKLLMLAEESRTAIQILNFCADSDEKILLDHADLFIKFIHSVLQRKYIDYILLKECLIGLQKIYKMKNDKSELCLMKITKLIMKTLGTMDNNWFLCAQELFDTIFLILSHPDLFCQYIIFRLTNVIIKENNYIYNNNINEMQYLGLGSNLNSNFPSTSIDVSHNLSQMKIDKDGKEEEIKREINDNNNIKMDIDDEDNPSITSKKI